jgi:hypothetical protein
MPTISLPDPQSDDVGNVDWLLVPYSLFYKLILDNFSHQPSKTIPSESVVPNDHDVPPHSSAPIANPTPNVPRYVSLAANGADCANIVWELMAERARAENIISELKEQFQKPESYTKKFFSLCREVLGKWGLFNEMRERQQPVLTDVRDAEGDMLEMV